jgi:hypothetical protein
MMQPKMKTSLFVILSFLLGVLTGAFGGKYIFLGRVGHGYSQKEIRKEFAERLKLDPTQQARVDSIVEVHRKNFNEIRKRFGGEFRAQRESLRADIKTLLTPEQVERYEEYIKEMDRKEADRRNRHQRNE